jgi:hypothetical protein
VTKRSDGSFAGYLDLTGISSTSSTKITPNVASAAVLTNANSHGLTTLQLGNGYYLAGIAANTARATLTTTTSASVHIAFSTRRAI